MLCRDVQFYLRLRKHAGDDLGADVTADLHRHLASCPVCAAESQAAESFDRAVAVAVRAVPIPPGLREKLHAQASAHRGTVIRHRVYRLATAAGLVFLALGLGLGLFSSRPKLDTAALVLESDAQLRDPEGSIRRWLEALRLAPELPVPPGETDPFDPELLVSLGTERLQGKDVPVAVFRHPTGRGFAKVYVFRTPGEFDLKSVPDSQGSLTLARVVNNPARYRGAVYVIVCTGPSLKPFLRAQPLGQPLL